MNVHIYLPVALKSIHVMIPIGLGFFVGILSGLFGVGGGFLITPFLIMVGIPTTVAIASSANQFVGASTSGTLTHWRHGNVDFKMGIYLLIGSFTGGMLGVELIRILHARGVVDVAVQITYVVLLSVIGSILMVEGFIQLRKRNGSSGLLPPDTKRENGLERFLKSLPFQTRFERSGVTHSALLPIVLGGGVGTLAAVMGIGGGFIMVPVMLYLLHMPMHMVVGTSLFQMLFTCTEITFLQAVKNHAVDFVLAFLLLLGSTVGTQIGATFGKKLHADQLKVLLAGIILMVAAKMVYDLTHTPPFLLALLGEHL